MGVAADKHHIEHNRQEHDLRAESRIIRATPELIPLMERGAHNWLHSECPPVPTLSHIMGFRTLKLFEIEKGDTFQTLDNLCFAIEEAGNNPKAHRIERAVGDLAIEAMRLQIPYIKEGLIVR